MEQLRQLQLSLFYSGWGCLAAPWCGYSQKSPVLTCGWMWHGPDPCHGAPRLRAKEPTLARYSPGPGPCVTGHCPAAEIELEAFWGTGTGGGWCREPSLRPQSGSMYNSADRSREYAKVPVWATANLRPQVVPHVQWVDMVSVHTALYITGGHAEHLGCGRGITSWMW